MKAIIDRVVWKGKSTWELSLGGIGFLLGLFLFLFCVQVYFDIDTVTNRRLGLEKQLDYVIISKQVDLAGLSASGEVGFDNGEIAGLEDQDFTVSVGEIGTNRFAARAELSVFGRGFVTELFFEAVPDDFLDIVPDEWDWEEGDPFVPVMISRDFLALYNFGYSQARGFPLVSEDMLKLVQIKLEIAGNNRYKLLNAQITALSDRIASILVPSRFMAWANGIYGTPDTLPARLIFSVRDRSNPEILRYIESHNYQTSRDKLRLSDAGFTITIVLSIIAFIGLLLISLSFIIFLTTFRLVVSRSSPEIRLLVDLGHTRKALVGSFMKILCLVFLVIFLADGILVVSAIGVYHTIVAHAGISLPGGVHPFVPAAGIFLVLLALAGNYLSLRLGIAGLSAPRRDAASL
ncbi:MAG: hypothetical protein JW881_00260 [Spirochaetales bacterium]|nr:hypothetical protein [Spirochaetales bacterium]